MPRRQDVAREVGDRLADVFLELPARVVREVARETVETAAVEEDARQSVVGGQVPEHRADVFLHFGQHGVEELGRLVRGHDVGDAVRQIEVGGPGPFVRVAEHDAGAAERGQVAAREGVDGGVDAQPQLRAFVDEGL